MRPRSFVHAVLAPVATLAIVTPAFVGLTAVAANAAPAELPFVVANHSGRADATYVYVIARNASTGAQGYVDGDGTWHAYSFPSSIPNGPVPAPDVSLPGPGNGASETITLAPNLSGGRIYVSMGAKLQFFLTTNGLVEPAPWVSTDSNANVLYDWTEFARTSNGGNGIFINSTTVDMFSMPITVNVTSTSGDTQVRGIPGDRQGILNAFSALGSPWSSLQTTRGSDGLPLRVLAPVHGIANGAFSTTYLDSYISAAWSYYASHTLTVQTSLGNFTGTTAGDNWTFYDSSGADIGTLTRPTTSDAFACSGGTQPQGQPNETAILAVGARVCAAINRATLSTSSRVESDTQPTSDPTAFYQQSASNLYSKTIHDNSLDGLAYGFSYDDVGGFAPTIDQPDPESAGMTIGSFGTDGGVTGGGAVTGDPITGLANKCVDVAGDDSGGDGAAVQLWDCQSYAVDQHWTYTADTLRTLGRCMDVTGGGTADGTKVQLWDCNGTGAQDWVHQANGSLLNPQSGRCLDDPGSSTANGARLQIWDCNGTGAQDWSSAQFGTGGGSSGTGSGGGAGSSGGGGVSATSRLEAEAFTTQSGTQTESTTDAGGGYDVGYISNGDWLEYTGVDFGSTGLTQFDARVASGAVAGVTGLVEVHLDSLANPAIGSFAIGTTGGWQTWQTIPANITTTTGTHTVYLEFTTGSGQDFVNLNWFTFSS